MEKINYLNEKNKWNLSKSICPLAWGHLFIQNDGSQLPCCFSAPYEKFATKAKLNVSDIQSLTDLQKSRLLQNIRQKMQQSEWPSICSYCQKQEKSSQQSPRLNYLKKYAHWISDKPQIRSIDIRLGNKCNLACRMCHPGSSHLLKADWLELGDSGYKKRAQKYKSMDWSDQQNVWDKVLQNLDHLEQISFAGGEPFIQKTHFQYLKKIIDSGYAKKIALFYNSNISQIPECLLEFLPHFKEIRIACSVDGYAQTQEYIRYHSSWSKIAANLELLDSWSQKYPNLFIEISSTMQVYNALSIHQLIDWLKRQNFKRIPKLPFFNIVYSPKYYSARMLPEKYKELAETKIKSSIDDLPKDQEYKTLYQQVNLFFSEMWQEADIEDFQKLKRLTKQWDQLRKQNISNIIPEWNESF